MNALLLRPHAVILDIDGVIWIDGGLASGSVELLHHLEGLGIPSCLLTNDCSVSKESRHSQLSDAGLTIAPDRIVTAPEATAEWLAGVGARRVMYLGAAGARAALEGAVDICESEIVDAVVVGDLFSCYDRSRLDSAARAVSDGARLVAMQRNRFWSDGVRSYVDNGLWVAGLEYVTGQQAVVTGKPSSVAYLTALRRLGQSSCDRSKSILVSDDMDSDLRGGKEFGMCTVYCGASKAKPEWVDLEIASVNQLIEVIAGDPRD